MFPTAVEGTKLLLSADKWPDPQPRTKLNYRVLGFTTEIRTNMAPLCKPYGSPSVAHYN